MPLKSETFYPSLPLLNSWVETYRFIEAPEPMQGETVANARIDAVITLQGQLSQFDKDQNQIIGLPQSCFFPFTRQGATRVFSKANTKLLNIKFYPHVLAASCFQNLSLRGFVDFEEVFGREAVEHLLASLGPEKSIDQMTVLLDDFLKTHLPDNPDNHQLLKDTISLIEQGATRTVTTESLAKKAGVSLKTLERNFKDHTGLTIKMYHDLVRFQKTARQINANGHYHHGDLLEALGSGYYDQSHFVKACRKLTGLSPKALFQRLPGEITDFVVF